MRKFILLAVCAFLLASCASTRSTLLTEDTALISARGQYPGDEGKVIDATLREAARLTRANGYRYFVIVTTADASIVGSTFAPNVRYRDQSRQPDVNGAVYRRSTTYGSGTLTSDGRRVRYNKPGLDITIRMYRPGEVNPESQGVWNSDVILGVLADAR